MSGDNLSWLIAGLSCGFMGGVMLTLIAIDWLLKWLLKAEAEGRDA